MRGHFRYLRFKTFPMTPRTPQCKVLCPFLSSSEHSGVPEDSQPPTFPSVGLHPHTWPKWGCDTAHKAGRVINQIRGRSYEQALMLLEFMPYRACHPILRLLSSATTNASRNSNLNKTNLIVTEARIDRGTTLKRFQPRAQGRAYRIHKPTCHITITVKNG